MAKLKTDPITDRELTAFAETDSDFGFEMQVLRRLRAKGFICSHSGTYQDPVTDKIRQFDIRASMDRGGSTLAMAVECKNLRLNNPLLLSAVPRTDHEAFHDAFVYRAEPIYPMRTIDTASGCRSAYKPGGMVGKKRDQVAIDTSGEFVSNDEATFEKSNQAVNSCRELVRDLAAKPWPPYRRVILPVLVVPTGSLWQVDYDPDGVIMVPPRPVQRATSFLNHTWSVPGNYSDTISYRLSHLEVITLEAVEHLADTCFGPDGFFVV